VTKIKKTFVKVEQKTSAVIFHRRDKLMCLPSYNRPGKTQRKLKATVNRCN